MNKKLYRDEYHKMLGGVCSGLAEYFDMDVTIVRLLFALTFFIMGAGLGTYIILWIVLPRKGYPYNNFNNPTVDYTVPPQQPGEPFTVGSNPFANRGYSGSVYENKSFGGIPSSNNPIESLPPKKSHAGIIIGLVLIFIGAAILIDEYDLIPDFEFDRLWPAVLVLVGAALIVSGQKRQPWERQEWQTAEKKEEPAPAVQPGDDSPATV